MAHEISLLDQIVTQAGTARAWHNLDKQVDLANLSVRDGAEASGLGHDVRVVPLTRIDTGDQTGLYGVYSDKNPEIFQTVSENFTPVQPYEHYEFAYGVAKAIGGKLTSAGTLRGTRHGFVCVELPDSIINVGGEDKLSRYISFNISWDGTYAISAMLWWMRQVCANTTPDSAAIDALGDNVLFYERKHKSLGKSAVDTVVNKLQMIRQEHLEKQRTVLERLTQAEFSDNLDKLRFCNLMADGAKVLDRIIQLDDANSNASFLDKCLNATIDRAAWEKVKIDAANNKAKSILYQMTYGQGQDLDTARDTAWGALNGMTYWQNHVAGSDGERGRKSDNDARFEKVIFGKHTADTNNATLLLSAIANTRA